VAVAMFGLSLVLGMLICGIADFAGLHTLALTRMSSIVSKIVNLPVCHDGGRAERRLCRDQRSCRRAVRHAQNVQFRITLPVWDAPTAAKE
jgi:hypothetical protein